MPIKKLINKNSNYYIAMYSAHASIIENLIGKRGTVKKLIVDAGGLKVPRGSCKNKTIFKYYLPETKKTLHAKIIYLDKPGTISLWTGNLRSQTLKSQENIVITKKVFAKSGQVIKKWFNTKKNKGHLILNVSGNKILKASTSNEVLWKSFRENLNQIVSDKNDELSLYAFSPWGSHKFVEEVVKVLKHKGLKTISLYTRAEKVSNPLWVDVEIENTEIKRYVRKSNKHFTLPHYKSIFITLKVGRTEKIIWAYVGSANLTQAALFKKTNIEFAAFFNRIKKGGEIKKIFKQLKYSNDWDLRSLKKRQCIDDSKLEFSDEDYSSDGFEVRNASNILCEELSKIKWQSKMETHYRYGTEFRFNHKSLIYKITVSSIHEGMLDLLVDFKKNSFSLSIKRIKDDEIKSKKEIEELVDSLLSKTTSHGQRKRKGEGEGGSVQVKEFRNKRFPIAEVIFSKELLNEKKEILHDLKTEMKRLKPVDKSIVEMWSQIIEQFN